MGQRRIMEAVHRTPVPGPQGDHAAVAGAGRGAVIGFADPQRVLDGAFLLVEAPAYPPGPAGLAFAGGFATAVPQHTERRDVEPGRPLQVVRTQAEIGEHGIHQVSADEYRHSSRAGSATPVTYSCTERNPSLRPR